VVYRQRDLRGLLQVIACGAESGYPVRESGIVLRHSFELGD
jgi:hypothetical protein